MLFHSEVTLLSHGEQVMKSSEPISAETMADALRQVADKLEKDPNMPGQPTVAKEFRVAVIPYLK